MVSKKVKKPVIMSFRQEWDFDPRTRVKENKKGKGSYNRKKMKRCDY